MDKAIKEHSVIVIDAKTGENEIILMESIDVFEEAKRIAKNTAHVRKFPFLLQYIANKEGFLLSILDMVGAIVEGKHEEKSSFLTLMNMEQLAFIKRVGCVESVQTEEGGNEFLTEEIALGDDAQGANAENNSLDSGAATERVNCHPATSAPKTAMMAKRYKEAMNPANVSSMAPASSSYCCCPSNLSMQEALEIPDESFTAGYISCPETEQWFKFTAKRTGRYTILTTGALDTIGTLYNDCGEQLAESDDYEPCGKINFRIIINLSAGSIYYVKVRLYNNQTGRYTLRVTEQVFANSVTINKEAITLVEGTTYELPITTNYIYKGYNGAQRIPGLSVSIDPANADEQKIRWYEQNGGVVNCSYGLDTDGDRYFHITATGAGTVKIYAEDWHQYGKRDECIVSVYCGGSNYKDVTQHELVLQEDKYYVCSKCGYRVKSPALQDKEILNNEDYYKVCSCYMAIPYYSVVDQEHEGNYSIRSIALRLIIDDIRSKSQYCKKYEYVDKEGNYKRQYTVGNENDDYYMPTTINYNEIDNEFELMFNNGVALGVITLLTGLFIPSQYQYLFFDMLDMYSNLTDFLCGLAEKVGYEEISIILKLILFGANIEEMKVTDRVVEIHFTVGAAVYTTKTVFDLNGNFKYQEHSVT